MWLRLCVYVSLYVCSYEFVSVYIRVYLCIYSSKRGTATYFIPPVLHESMSPLSFFL